MATLVSNSSTTANASSATAGSEAAALEMAVPEVRTLAERVFHQLQDAIVRGELAPGSKITEPGLSKTYGISRGPLREAMRRLEAHRLIERVPHVGARVVQLSMKELLELFDLREALESMAARLAAEHMSPEEVQGLRDVLALHEGQADLKRGEAYYQREGDLDFHYCIVQGSHNKMLMNLLCDDLYYLALSMPSKPGTPSWPSC